MLGMSDRSVHNALPAGVVLLCLSSLAAAQAYSIRFTRPWKVGDRYRILATASSSAYSGATVGSTMVNTNIGDINVELLSDATVLEIRPDGRIAKVSLVIYKCIFRKDDKKKAVPRETLVIASVENGDQVFRVNGQPVDPDTATALSLVLWLDPQEKSEDQVFGTSEQKRVGESWAIKAASVADWPLQARTDATGADIKGVVTVSKPCSFEPEQRKLDDADLQCCATRSIRKLQFSPAHSGANRPELLRRPQWARRPILGRS